MKLSSLLFLSLATLLSPFAMAASTTPDGGVLITRLNNQQWQIRLIGGSSAERFSGVVDSSIPFSKVSAVNAANVDGAKLMTSTSLGTTLNVQPGGVDGVDFSVSPDSALCLRDTGSSSGVHIYLGDSLDDAIPVTAPVALTSADACGDNTAMVLSATSGRKSHMGHYIALGRGVDSQQIMAESIKPGVVGFSKRYTWRSLEPSQGVYQFSEIKSDLGWAAAHGMYLIVMIEDRTFTNEKAGPAYLDKYDMHNRSGGYTMVRWNPTVETRWMALVKALGAQVDSNKNFEGIATQETSIGLDAAELKASGYTPQKYRDSYITILSSAARSLPTSRVFWYMNFLLGGQSYIGNIAAAVAPLGVVMGGPDVWPDNKSLQSKVYPFYTQFYKRMPLFGQVENVCYSEPHMTRGFPTKYWTMTELFNYARTRLHVSYMFWVRVTQPNPKGSYDWLNALPVIAANANFAPAP
jgi:hypothetical protein